MNRGPIKGRYVKGPRTATKTSHDNQCRAQVGGRDLRSVTQECYSLHRTVVTCLNGQTSISIWVEEKDKQVQRKQKDNFGVSLQLNKVLLKVRKYLFSNMSDCHIFPPNSE